MTVAIKQEFTENPTVNNSFSFLFAFPSFFPQIHSTLRRESDLTIGKNLQKHLLDRIQTIYTKFLTQF